MHVPHGQSHTHLIGTFSRAATRKLSDQLSAAASLHSGEMPVAWYHTPSPVPNTLSHGKSPGAACFAKDECRRW